MSSPDEGTPISLADPGDDEAPDMVRMGILSAVLLLLVGYFVWTHFINPPKKPYYADLPGFEAAMAAMTPQQRDDVLKQANAMQCDCGYPNCSYNVAECRHMDPGCDVSAKHAAEIIAQVTGGKAPPLPSNLEPGAEHHMGTPLAPGSAPGATGAMTPASPAAAAGSSGATSSAATPTAHATK
jgi:hypothetical protein